MTAPEPPEYLEFLAPYPLLVQEQHRAARQKLATLLPECVEVIWDATQTVVTGWGFGDKTKDSFLGIAAYPKHVTLIFMYGVRLDDPERRLRGEGNQVRNLRLAGLETLDDPYVQKLIQQSVATAPTPTGDPTPRILVKQMAGPKRRPNQS
ncbi:MAG: DUF1801 domain-containing protein [Armatimonadetes bacterium]|nr:DUF1801 domain-containing protein [Armatimonadota bacterium]